MLVTEALQPVPTAFRALLEQLVSQFAAGNFIVDGHDCGPWVRDYPATLVPLPPEAWDVARAGRVTDRGWWITVPLWTAEEGRSDLTLTADASEYPTRVTGVDIHVL